MNYEAKQEALKVIKLAGSLEFKSYLDLAVEAIIVDLTDRGGLSDEWEMIDEDTRQEIKDVWVEIIRQAVTYNLVGHFAQ